jgi:hypothetical protein
VQLENSVDDISVEHNASPAKLDIMGVYDWPVWNKEVSTFAWTYDKAEVCYLLDGAATITPQDGVPVRIEAGDLVIFPKGMICTWQIHEAVSKHYEFK